MRLFLLIVLALGLAACGDVTLQDPKSEKDQGQDEQAGTDGHDRTLDEKDPAAATAEHKADKSEIPNDTGDDGVTVNVDVAVTVTRDDGSSSTLEGARYTPVYRPWQEAVDHAPKGYRLASRAELVALIDAGTIAELGAADAELWSSTEDDKRIAQFVDGDSGRSAPMDKTMPLSAVYVRGSK